MTYACHAGEFAAEFHLLKLQRLQNSVLRTIGNFPSHTSVCDMQQAEVVQNHKNENVRSIGQGKARHRKYKRLKLGSGHVYDCSSIQTAVVA
jgi:hypothetical protein